MVMSINIRPSFLSGLRDLKTQEEYSQTSRALVELANQKLMLTKVNIMLNGCLKIKLPLKNTIQNSDYLYKQDRTKRSDMRANPLRILQQDNGLTHKVLPVKLYWLNTQSIRLVILLYINKGQLSPENNNIQYLELFGTLV